MIRTSDELLRVAARIFGSNDLPREFSRLITLQRYRAERGRDQRQLARDMSTNAKRVGEILAARDPVGAIFGTTLGAAEDEETTRKVRKMLGQLLLGSISEHIFEDIYRTTMGTEELRLEDDRAGQTDTDYRVVNGGGRQVFRINIKYHGSLFNNAQVLVGIPPPDCFALATYKIHQALLKQEEEVLPYLFVVVGVRELTGDIAGAAVPPDLAHFMSFVRLSKMAGKRVVEDKIVNYLLTQPQKEPYKSRIMDFRNRIASAPWAVLSARKADKLLKEKLYDRVYALRVRGFAQHYRNAELDMHFSISQDLTPFLDFLKLLKTSGLHGIAGHLERGLI